MAKLIFINLPVSDLARATVFYQAIGAKCHSGGVLVICHAAIS
jgi:predicted lactoylglutathione lyase